jgi:UDP-N-acetylglucosamine enolpyruvyl transferase
VDVDVDVDVDVGVGVGVSSEADVASVPLDVAELLEVEELVGVVEVVEAHPVRMPTSEKPTAVARAELFRRMRFMIPSMGANLGDFYEIHVACVRMPASPPECP